MVLPISADILAPIMENEKKNVKSTEILGELDFIYSY